MAMVCSYDYGCMTLALCFAILCGNVLHNVLIQQRRYLCHSSCNLRRRQRQRQQQQQQGQGTTLDGSKEEDDEEYEKDDEDDFYFDDFSILAGRRNRSVDAAASEDGRGDDDDDDGHGRSSSSSSSRSSSSSSRVLQYMAVRLPFELYAGYILSLCNVYLNAAIINNATPTWVYLLIANLCLVGLLGIGCILLWRGRVYGIGISLIWYLVSSFVTAIYIHMCVWLCTL